MTDKTTDLVALLQSGSLFDTFTGNVAAQVSTARSQLLALGNTEAAAALQAVNANAITSLYSHVGNSASGLFDQMSTFASVGAFGSTNAVTDVAAAFGPQLAARSAKGGLEAILAEASKGVDANMSLITDHANQVRNAASNASTLISNQSAFFTAAQTKLQSFSQASQILNMFRNPNLMPVLGAIGSDALLNILRRPDNVESDAED